MSVSDLVAVATATCLDCSGGCGTWPLTARGSTRRPRIQGAPPGPGAPSRCGGPSLRPAELVGIDQGWGDELESGTLDRQHTQNQTDQMTRPTTAPHGPP